jgi:hypothetical protein
MKNKNKDNDYVKRIPYGTQDSFVTGAPYTFFFFLPQLTAATKEENYYLIFYNKIQQ